MLIWAKTILLGQIQTFKNNGAPAVRIFWFVGYFLLG